MPALPKTLDRALPPLRQSYRLTPRGEWWSALIHASWEALVCAICVIFLIVLGIYLLARWYVG